MFLAVAMAQTAGAAVKQPSVFENLFPMLLIFVVFYFLIIVPQRNQKKKHGKFLEGLKRGDEVLTASGILGKIEGITEQYVTLEVDDDVKIKVLKTQIAGTTREQTK